MHRWNVTTAAEPSATPSPAGLRAADQSRTFVLVHGAFHGGWCWAKAASLLRACGHNVHTPTFTGLGERAHLLSPSVDMNTFVRDILNLIEVEELREVVLVGHSFGGYVITAVADLIPERLARLVYLDAAVAISGASPLSELPPGVREERLRSATRENGVRVFSAPGAGSFGVTDEVQVAWLTRRMSPMPVAAYETALQLRMAPGSSIPKHYIRCTGSQLRQSESGFRHARDNGWECSELSSGHDVMITAPDALTRVLMDL